ncbi:MAG: gamma-glutamyl-gamma-aminobutyrate hydrolase family protein [Nitrospirota bacterium]
MGRPRPKIVVVSRRLRRKQKWVDFVGEAHLDLLLRLGALPVMVPVAEGAPAAITEYARDMSGLLLVEGEDLGPERHRPPPASRAHIKETHPLKDEIEFRLCRLALKRRTPILGICRGSQVLNVIGGGTLYCDVMKEMPSALPHIADAERYDAYRHPVTIVRGTPLYRWYGQERIEANSYHHQGVKALAKRYRPMAYAADGLIEGFYDPHAPFLVGLQFHPERMVHDYAGNRAVFRAFVNAAKTAR